MHTLSITDVRVLPGDAGFLIDDGETAILYDSGFGFTGEKLAQNIKNTLKDRQLDYIFLTHSHYDHVFGAVYVKKHYPHAKIVAGSYAAHIFKKDSAKHLMRELDKKFALKNGIQEYEDLLDSLSVDIEVADNDSLRCGKMDFTIIALPGHTKCSIGFYLKEKQLLLGTETLGVYTDSKKIIPSYLVGYNLTLQSFAKIENLDIKHILIPHYGMLSSEETQYYLQKGKEIAIETATQIAMNLKAGISKAEILQQFKHQFYDAAVKTIYPIDAMELNTNIMIHLIEKELLS